MTSRPALAILALALLLLATSAIAASICDSLPQPGLLMADLLPGRITYVCGTGQVVETIQDYCEWFMTGVYLCSIAPDTIPEAWPRLKPDDTQPLWAMAARDTTSVWYDIMGRRVHGEQARGLYFEIIKGRVIAKWRTR